MNWLFGLVVLFLIISAVIGYKKGFVKIAYALVSTILALFLVSILAPHVQTFIIEKTQVYEKVVAMCEEQIEGKLQGAMEETEMSVSATLESAGIKVPEALGGMIEKIGIKDEYTTSVAQKTSAAIAGWLIMVLSFVLTYIVIVIVLKIAERALNIITKLPILKGANKSLGVAMGLLQGFINLWIAALVLSMVCTTDVGMQLTELVNENVFLKFIYDHNGILYLVSLFWK